MCGNIVCLATVLLGVDARWPPLPDGGLQYVIQIEPHALHRRESGAYETIRSRVPPYVKDVRAYQIVIGTQRLAKNVPTPNVHSPILTGVDTDWVSLPAGGFECRVWIQPDVLDELQKPGRVIEGKIPANVRNLSVFTISVGTKPRAVGSPTTNDQASPSEPVEAKADQPPAEPPPGPPITPPLEAQRSNAWPPPGIGPPPPGSPYPPNARTVPNAAAPPDVLSDPGVLPLDANSMPIPVKQANHIERSETTPDDRPPAKAAKKPSSAEDPAKPWASPAVLLVGLFASLGGNVFLLWIMRDFRSRYRALLRRMADVGDIVRGCVLELERSS